MIDISIHDRSVAVAQKLCDEVRVEYEAMFDTTRRSALIKTMAKHMCSAEGHDPDMVVIGSANQVPYQGPKGTTAVMMPIAPAWVAYAAQARVALDVAEAAQQAMVA